MAGPSVVAEARVEKAEAEGADVAELTAAYTSDRGELSTEARVELIRLLSSYRDPRAAPAFEKALRDFVRLSQEDETQRDVYWALEAIGELRLEALAAPTLAVFDALRASSPLGASVSRPLATTMTQLASKSWTDALLRKLAVPLGGFTKGDAEAENAHRDQLYWQGTAADVLAAIRAPRAAKPLVAMFADPSKWKLEAKAGRALVRLGKAASDAALGLASGEDAALLGPCLRNDFWVPEARERRCRNSGAQAVSFISHPSAVPGLVAIVRAEKDPKLRWDLARRLPTLPRTPESVAAFREAIEALLPARLAEKGELERPTLSDTAEFHDPELVPWLLSQVRQARGVREQREAFQRDVLRAVVELGTKAQLPLLRDALLHYGDAETRVRFGRIEALLEACRTDALCYVEALTDPWHQAEDASHVATKAGRMAVVFGDATTRLELIERFPRIYGDSARLAAARAVLSLTLDGGAAVTPRIRRFLAEESRADGESESDALSWSQILEDLLVQLENRVLG